MIPVEATELFAEALALCKKAEFITTNISECYEKAADNCQEIVNILKNSTTSRDREREIANVVQQAVDACRQASRVYQPWFSVDDEALELQIDAQIRTKSFVKLVMRNVNRWISLFIERKIRFLLRKSYFLCIDPKI